MLWPFLLDHVEAYKALYANQAFLSSSYHDSTPERQQRVAREATEFKERFGTHLSKQVNTLLSRISSQLAQP